MEDSEHKVFDSRREHLVLPGYTLGKVIFQNDRIKILEATRSLDQQRFAVMTTQPAFSGPEGLAYLRSTYALAKKLDSPVIPNYRESIEAGHKLFLLMDHLDAEPLVQAGSAKLLHLKEKLKLALSVSKLLVELEAKEMVLPDIRPRNILRAPASNSVYFADLGQLAYSGGNAPEKASWMQREGMLQYIAPERTGRTSWAAGPWSDQYSFGITLYELFAGGLPFTSDDPLELLHFHTAGTPPQLASPGLELPQPLNHLIHRLLAKAPTDRYQTASGLEQDLIFILENFGSAEVMRHFRIGAFDVPSQVRLPDKVFGREAEMSKLKSVWELAKEGGMNVVVLTGAKGLGKSAFAKAFGAVVRGEGHVFLEGYFSKNPLEFRESGLVGAIRKLVRRLLSGDSDRLSELKRLLEEGLGRNLGVLAETIPEVEVLLGKVDAPESLDVREEQSRFAFLLRKLLKLLAGPQFPLVIFLDDFEHADAFSESLIREMFVNRGLHHLLFVLSVEGEMDCDELMEDLEGSTVHAERIDIKPLSLQEVAAFFDTAMGPNAKNRRLAKIAFRRTKGIPSLLNQFLLLLRDQGLLSFELSINAWDYDLDAVEAQPIPENMAELIRSRAETLPDDVVRLLGVAAVLGYHFRSGLLANLLDVDTAELHALLQEALHSGVIGGYLDPSLQKEDHLPKDYSFQHTDLHNHFYGLVPDSIRSEYHGRAFSALWSETVDVNSPYAYDILFHLGQSVGQVAEVDEERLLQLSLDAGNKAIRERANPRAKRCFNAGLTLLDSGDSKGNPLGFDLRLSLAKVESFLGNHAAAKATYLHMLQSGVTHLQELRVADDLCQLYISQGQHEDCLETAIRAFERSQLMKPIPRKKGRSRFEVIRNVLKLRRKIRGAEERLRWLPKSDNPELGLTLSLFRRVVVSALSVNPNLFALVVLRQVDLTLKYGLSPFAPSAFLSYSIMNLVGFKDYKGALDVGHLSLSLRKKVGKYSEYWESEFAYSHFLMHMEKSLRHHLGHYLEVQKGLVQKGNPLFAGYALNSRIWTMGTLGMNLKEIHDEASRYLEEFRLRKDLEVMDMMRPKTLAIEALQGRLKDPWSLKTGDYDPEAKFKELEERGSKSILGGLILAQLELSWFFRRHEEGLATALRGAEYLPNMEGIYFSSDYYLFTVLHHLGAYLESGKRPGGKSRKWIKKVVKRFGKLHSMQEENYASPVTMMESAYRFLAGETKVGIKLMLEAIALASRFKFTRNYAMASELCFEMMRKEGLEVEERRQHLLNARQGYLVWGADAKARSLEERYPMVLSRNVAEAELGDLFGNDALELSSILKAANALSKEIRLSGLLETLVGILLENAGAQRAVFLLNEREQLRVEVMGEVEEGGIQYQRPQTAPQPDQLPVSLVKYVARSGEMVRVDAKQPGEWAEDPYLLAAKPPSALCHPIFHQGELIGLAYLENKLVSNTFTPARVEILNLLSGQIGISIANARLYENLEAKVQERTEQIESQKEEIELARQKSDQLLLNILPEAVATELKETGRTTARRYEEVTILFSDIVGFTRLAEKLRPEELVRTLDRYFGMCDKVVADLGLEKVKTIGDAYMCAGGISAWNPECHVNVVHAAIAMLRVAEELREEGMEIEIRIGIHTGPVVAGVVGSTKFAYDIWGDAVNTAARMETAGEPGLINVSQETWGLIKAEFDSEYRGEIEVKGKGALPMYFIKEQ